MTFEKREEIISLYDAYGSLLTDKQRDYFESYYFDDLSISEIATNFEVSRNAVFDQIKRVNLILMDYEGKLKIVDKTS
ncbi:MAG: DNA-binding protein, partial [Anaeroplasmataceae bacterium]|nr:DNA-binding protein [Anaeroplasmataceae bacterium]